MPQKPEGMNQITMVGMSWHAARPLTVFVKNLLRPYRRAVFHFLTLCKLRRSLADNPHAPNIRRVVTDTRTYLCRTRAPRERARAYTGIDSLTPPLPPPAKTLGESRLTAAPFWFSREAFVVRLDEVRVLGEWGHVLTRDGTLLADVSFETPVNWHLDDAWRRLVRLREPGPPLGGTSCLLMAKWGGFNYFHFLFELLPRCEMVRRSGIALETIDHFIVNRPESHVFREGLEECGVVWERVLFCDDSTVFEVEHVIAPSTLRGKGHLSRWVCDWLNQAFTPKTGLRRKAVRLYVGRDDAGTRRLTNQEEILEQVLLPLGFEPVRWSGEGIGEQAARFATADVVVGVNGAALSNLVFCAPGTRVIVIHYPVYLSRYFYELSYTCGLDYYYLVGETTAPLSRYEHNRDYFVNPAALAALLKVAGVN